MRYLVLLYKNIIFSLSIHTYEIWKDYWNEYHGHLGISPPGFLLYWFQGILGGKDWVDNHEGLGARQVHGREVGTGSIPRHNASAGPWVNTPLRRPRGEHAFRICPIACRLFHKHAHGKWGDVVSLPAFINIIEDGSGVLPHAVSMFWGDNSREELSSEMLETSAHRVLVK